MPVIDERGRLFGRFNLIDALVALVGIVLIPMSYGAYLMFRPPVPKIVSVTPQELPETLNELTRPRIQITGENLREALMPKFGEILAPGFLVLDARHAEVVVPSLPAGTYDLSLSDGGRRLFTLPGAVRVVVPAAPVKPVPPPVKTAMAMLTVRFVAEPEVLDVMKAGDSDVGIAAEPPVNSAVLKDLSQERETTSALITAESVLGRNFQIHRPVQIAMGSVLVPVTAAPTGWMYKERAVKVGAPFSFASTSGAMGGVILTVRILR